MNRSLVLVLAAWVLLPLFYGFAQDTEPEEPEIILPRVILEIEDLSVEDVTAGIPGEEYITFPDWELPLPEPEDLELEEPFTELLLPQANGAASDQEKEKYLDFEGVLGAGNLNHLMSAFSLYRFELQPEGRLQFSHEVTDGFSGTSVGSGYNMREDRLAGSVTFDVRRLKIKAEGGFDDLERGLQGNGSYYSKIDRFGRGGAVAEYTMNDRFVLKGEAGASVTSQLLTQSGSSVTDTGRSTEYLLSSSLEGTYLFERGFIGVSPRYSYRSGSDTDLFLLNRLALRGFFGVEISGTTSLEGEMGWFWSDDTDNLFPFHLTLSAFPTDLFSFRTSLGYRLEEFNLASLSENYPLADIPDSLNDNSGWFFDISSHFNISQGWVLYGGLFFMDNGGILTPGESLDPTTGLFPIGQEESLQLSAEAGIRWNKSVNFSTYVSWRSELIDKPQFFPKNSLNFEMSWIGLSGKYGGTLYSVFYTGVNDFIQAPVVDIHSFYRITDTIRLGVEVEDLLYPVLDDPRYGWYPYIDMGLRFTLKTYFTF